MSANTGVHTCSYYCERPECVRRQRDELRARLEAALAQQPGAREGFVMVPVEPSEGVLVSMAIRYDHGLGVPGYYDQPLFGGENGGHKRRMESTVAKMRQLYEEVVGAGFYSRGREEEYAALAQQPAAVDEAKETDLWRCTVCGRVGTVGRCCGEETRERANMESLLAEIEERREEVEGLRAELMESDEIHEKLRHLLTRIAAALKGEPPEGVWHSWHDLPERAALAVRRAERLAEALEDIRSRSCMNLAMNPNPYELTALLGDIHKIADAALSKEEGK